jgi:hypothetical protein
MAVSYAPKNRHQPGERPRRRFRPHSGPTQPATLDVVPVALAWTPLAGVQTYTVYRAHAADQNFAAIGIIAGPSFSDTGLSPATSFAYKVTVSISGSEGPASPVGAATTLPVPPRCPAPGSCSIAR